MFLLFNLMILPFIGSIRNKSYPEVLSQEEERKYLIEHSKGNKNARNKLIEHNLRLVAHIVKKYENTFEDRDDLISIGTIGLVKAVDTFKINNNNKLSTYAARCIENEILMKIRSNKKRRNVTLLQNSINGSEDGDLSLLDVISDSSMGIEERILLDESINKLNSILPILNEREKEIITRRYGLNNVKSETQKEIAKDLEISRSYVSRIEKRALMKLYMAYKEIT